jgi:hypothetical protein
MTAFNPDQGTQPFKSASVVASRVLLTADRDVAFVLQIVGESRQVLSNHFYTFIESSLRTKGVTYQDHPFLRPIIEGHSRDLMNFVHGGVALHHQLSLSCLGATPVDPLNLLRVDLWDSLRTHIEQAEAKFLGGPHGLASILSDIDAFKKDHRQLLDAAKNLP